MVSIGIDFGTSYTFVVKRDDRDGESKFSVIGEGLYENNGQSDNLDVLRGSRGIRTEIAYNKTKNSWFIPKESDSDLSDCVVISDLKTKLRNICDCNTMAGLKRVLGRDYVSCNKIILEETSFEEDNGQDLLFVASNIPKNDLFGYVKPDGSFINAIDLAYKFISKIFEEDLSSNYMASTLTDVFNDVDAISIGVPAVAESILCDNSFGYRNIIVMLITKFCQKQLNLDKIAIKIYDEPALATVAYSSFYNRFLEQNDQILTIDIGGGTADFSILKYQGVNVIPSVERTSYGTYRPAGQQFDDAIQDAFDQVGITIQLSARAKQRLKEGMFKTKDEFRRISSSTDDIDVEYGQYKESGRRSTYESNTIVFDDNHMKSTDGAVPQYKEEFNEQSNNIISEIAKYIGFEQSGETYKKGKNAATFNSIFFMGGTCSMDLLREKILEQLNIITKDRGYYHYIDDSQEIDVSYFEIQDDQNGTSSTVVLTNSNAVALGAAITPTISNINNVTADRATEENKISVVPSKSSLVSAPTIKVICKDNNSKKEVISPVAIMSQAIYNGTCDVSTCFVPIIKENKAQRFYFRIIIEADNKITSSTNYYWAPVPGNIGQNVDFIFFADSDKNNNFSVFCCINENGFNPKNVPKNRADSYRFYSANGKETVFDTVLGIPAKKKNFRRYDLGISGWTDDIKKSAKSEQRQYDIKENKAGFVGWKIISNDQYAIRNTHNNLDIKTKFDANENN